MGILAFGSLINDPGQEILELESCRIDCETPFKVEFARISSTRGNAPTLIPVKENGSSVRATIIVLRDGIDLNEAKDILYRREIHKVGSNKKYDYPENPTEDQIKKRVKLEVMSDFMEIRNVLFISFGRNIEQELTAELLSEYAIESILSKAGAEEKDGVRYLLSAKRNGLITPLSGDYERQILAKTETKSLEEAIKKLDKQRMKALQ